MSFVPIDTIKDLFTGSVWDKFKEMIEPYALVSAIVLMVLNLALVFPAWPDLSGNAFVAALSAASDAWKVVFGTVVLFVLSYILNHLSALAVSFASGEVFRDSRVIGTWLQGRQSRRFDGLGTDAKTEPPKQDPLKRDRAAFRLAYEFPVDRAELGLTRLGNLLRSPPSYISHQYGASMRLTWPYLELKLPEGDKTLKSIQGNWVSLQFFTTLCAVLVFVAIETILVAAPASPASAGSQAVALLAFAYLCYYVSLERARQWGSGMRRVFDLHVKEIFTDLGMEALKDLNPGTGLKSSMEAVMGWLAYGAIKRFNAKPSPTWYKASSAEVWPQVKKPAFLDVQIFPPFKNTEVTSTEPGFAYASYEYLFAVTNTSTEESPVPGKEAYLLVQDGRVEPPDTVDGRLSTAVKSPSSLRFVEVPVEGMVQRGEPDGILFPLGDIPPGHSRVLRYCIGSPIASVKASIGLESITLTRTNARSISDTELFIDVIPEGKKARKADIKIEILSDDPLKLDGTAEWIPAPDEGKSSVEGDVWQQGRFGVWHISTEAEMTGRKIRFRLEG